MTPPAVASAGTRRPASMPRARRCVAGPLALLVILAFDATPVPAASAGRAAGRTAGHIADRTAGHIADRTAGHIADRTAGHTADLTPAHPCSHGKSLLMVPADRDPRYGRYDLLHAELELRLDPAAKEFSGSVRHRLRSVHPGLKEVLLAADANLELLAVRRGGRSVPVEHRAGHLIVSLDPALAPDETTTVTIDYRGRPKWPPISGMLFQEQGDPAQGFPVHPVISTQSEPRAGSAFWPCKNIPDDKFSLDARWIVPEPLFAAGNGTLVDDRLVEPGWRSFHWREDYPISTYLVSVVATDFAAWSDTYVSLDSAATMPVHYWAYRQHETQARAIWSRTPQMIAAFARRFGEYPFLREKYAMAEYEWIGAMEHQTCTSLGAHNLLFDVPSGERVVAHELAHQWWGDLVGPATWDDIWLNEGFAVFSEALWREQTEGRPGYLAHMQDVYREQFEGPLVPPVQMFGPAVYFKGAWVLHMLRHRTGDRAFFGALRAWAREHAFTVATTEEFRRLLERHAGIELDEFFARWVYGTGMPVYAAAWTWQEVSGPDKGRLDLTLQQVQAEEPFAVPLTIVLRFAHGGTDTLTVENDGREQRFAFSVPEEPADLAIDPEGWVLKKVLYVRGPTGVEAPFDPRAWRWGLAAWPNPSPGPATIDLRRLDRAGRTEFTVSSRSAGAWGPSGDRAGPIATITDPLGRIRQKVSLNPGGAADGWRADWDGRGLDGRPLPAGVYWIHAMGGGARPVRLVIFR